MNQETAATEDALALHAMARKTVEMLELAREGFRRQDQHSCLLAARLGPALRDPPGRGQLSVAAHLGGIADATDLLLGAITAMIRDGVPFTNRATREVDSLFERTVELLECLRDALVTRNRVLIRYVVEQGGHFAELTDDYAMAHQQRLIEGVCLPRASALYLTILDALRAIEAHARHIALGLGEVGAPVVTRSA